MVTGKSRKAKARAEKGSKFKTKMSKSKHKLRQVKNCNLCRSQTIVFTETVKLSDANYRAIQQPHVDGTTCFVANRAPVKCGSSTAFARLANALYWRPEVGLPYVPF